MVFVRDAMGHHRELATALVLGACARRCAPGPHAPPAHRAISARQRLLIPGPAARAALPALALAVLHAGGQSAGQPALGAAAGFLVGV